MKAKSLAVVGGCLLTVGIVIGLVPVSSSGASCGSAMNGEAHLTLALTQGETVADNCQSLLSVVALPMWALLGVGLLLLIAAAIRASLDD